MNGLWQGAWHIARYELRSSWGGLIMTFLMLAYIVLCTLPLMGEMLEGDLHRSVRWAVDLMYFCVLPNMGFLLNRSAFKYFREDSYSRKLAMWQTLPIRLEQIVAGRFLLMLAVAIPAGLFFFGLQYAVLTDLREALDPAAYANYALCWFGYSMFMAVTYVYMELGFPGKVYLAICFGYIPIYGLLTLALWLSGTSAVTYTLEAAISGNWLPPVIALAAAAHALAFWSPLIKRRIRARSLWN